MSPKNDELELRRKAEAEAETETERRAALEAQQAEVRAEAEGALRGQSAEDEAAAEHAEAIAWQRAEMRKEMGEEEEQERRVPDAAVRPYVRDPDMDPAWLDRWEGEGTMTPLTDEEREKLKAIDREDPVGRGQREMFLPREVLAIRALSDRRVAEREQAKEAEKAQEEPVQVEPAQEEERAVPQAPERQEQQQERKSAAVVKVEQEQEPDDDMEMDR